MDNRVNNGGARGGAGRKPKADEIKLIEALDRHIDSDQSIRYLTRTYRRRKHQSNTDILRQTLRQTKRKCYAQLRRV
jgi:hypothetical protein